MKTTAPPEEKALDIGTVASAAVTRQFKNLLGKIKNGSITAPEMKLFNELERRIKSELGQEDGVTFNRLDVAKKFNRAERTISNWIRDGMPVRPDGGFCFADIETWLASRQKKKNNPTPDDADYWQKEYKKNRAKLSELELKLKRGDLLAKLDVIAAFKEMQSYVKKNLALIPRIAPGRLNGLGPNDMQAVLTEITTGILTGMSQGQSAKHIEGIIKK